MSSALAPDLAVVVPAYNEQDCIASSIAELRAYLIQHPWSWEIRVVDDGSEDGTAGVVAAAAGRDPRVVLQREPHRGKGGAVRAGMEASQARYRFLCDADLSMPVREIVRFLPPALDGFDVAIGTREGAGARRIAEPWHRHLAGRAFNAAVRAMLIPGIQDTQCGFKMFTAASAQAIFPLTTVDGWAFDIEVLAIARRQGLVVKEVPIEWHYMPQSRVRMMVDGPRMLREVLRMRRRARAGKYDRPSRAGPA